ncbi:MAG: DNA methyltransferase [Pyrinomonadaceae bacterium]
MIFHIVLETAEDGWIVAECPSLPGCVSQGKTEPEAIENIKEAITAWLWAEDQKAINSLPKPIKPIELIEFLIKLTTKENQIVLDPFIGSGTTAVASQSLKRRFIGFEINQNYFKNASERLKEISFSQDRKIGSEATPLFEAL